MKKNDGSVYVKKNYYFQMFKVCREHWSFRSPLKKACMKNARQNIDGLEKWQCADCYNFFAKSEVACDHIDPIAIEPTNLDEFKIAIERLDSSKLQSLCKKCHQLKTKNEMNGRNLAYYKKIIDCENIFSIDLLANSDYKLVKRIYDYVIKYKNAQFSKEKDSYKKKILKIVGEI